MTRPLPAPATVTISANGREIRVPADVSVAAALVELGVVGFRVSASGEPRGPLCGMGTCFECRVTIDGTAHRRACLVRVVEGMTVTTSMPTTGEVA